MTADRTWAPDRAEYNLRQLRLAARALREYTEGGRSLADLGRLIATLDALEAAMESADGRWLWDFNRQGLALETVYAVRLDRGGGLDGGDEAGVEEAVERLQALVAAGIAANEEIVGGSDDEP